MMIADLAYSIPAWPHGHVNNATKSRLAQIAVNMTLDDLAELNGLVARAHFLIANPPPPNDNTPPDGGSAAPMALAA